MSQPSCSCNKVRFNWSDFAVISEKLELSLQTLTFGIQATDVICKTIDLQNN